MKTKLGLVLLLLTATGSAAPAARWTAWDTIHRLFPGFQILQAVFASAIPVTSYTFVQQATNNACASGTSCSVTVSTIGSGHLLVIGAQWNDTANLVSSLNVAGSWNNCSPCTMYNMNGSFGQITGGWQITTGTQATPLVVNYVNTSAASQVWVWEYSCSPSCPTTGIYDGANVIENAATASFTAPGFTPSGNGNDISLQVARSGNSATLTAGSFTGLGTSFYHGARLTTPATSWSSPNWTLTSGDIENSQIEFGSNTTACRNVKVVDNTGGTNTTALTAALVNGGTFGWQAGTPRAADVHQGASNKLTYATAAFKALLTTISRMCDGTAYNPGSSTATTGVDYPTASTGTIEFVQWGAQGHLGASNELAMGFWFESTMPATDSSVADVMVINGSSGAGTPIGSEFNNVHMLGSGSSQQIQIEAAGSNSSVINIAQNTWYWIVLYFNYPTTGNGCTVAPCHVMRVYSGCSGANGVGCSQITGSPTAANSSGSTFFPEDIQWGGNHATNAITTGFHFYYGAAIVDGDSTDPLYP